LDETGLQRSGSELADIVLLNDGKLIDLGLDINHAQNVTFNFKPKLPNIGGISRFIDIAGSYTNAYNWNDPLQSNPEIKDQAKNAGWNSNMRVNLGFRLKSVADQWFGVGKILSPVEAAKAKNDSSSKFSLLKTTGKVFKTIFLDWEKVDFIFNQTRSSLNPGVYGGTGFTNFWSRGMLFRESLNEFGPSWAYQMGLIEHPHGGFDIVGSDKFPFFGFDTFIGLRPSNAILQDNFREQTSLEIRTARPLWEGASIDLNWKSELGFNKNQTVNTDEFGNPTFSNINATESFNRTFLTFPSIFGFNPFNNTIENVVAIFNVRREAIENSDLDSVSKNVAIRQALNESFFEGLKMFGGTGRVAKFLPSVNWNLRWEGIEKWEMWNGMIKRLTLEHAYAAQYQENVLITDNGRDVQTQTIQYGFQPLIGLNANFDDELFSGTLTAQLRWSTQNSFQVNSAAGSTISKQSTNEITAQAEYTMQGFEFPLFGILLKNDLSWIALFTFKDNSRATYDVLDQTSFTGDNEDGRTLDGNIQIIAEPRIRYSISNRLIASFFVRYEGTITEGAAQPGFNTVQVGFDLRISIAGGR
jgi:cell surface protein SprA